VTANTEPKKKDHAMRADIRSVLKSAIAAGLIRKQVQAPTTERPVSAVQQGILLHVDSMRREVQFQAGEQLLQLYVPRDCFIALNDERVKLRMLQPFDPARIRWMRENGRAVAEAITVHWDSLTGGSDEESVSRAAPELVQCH
jgi:hypothetical protein